jgi:hypothetical protein
LLSIISVSELEEDDDDDEEDDHDDEEEEEDHESLLDASFIAILPLACGRTGPSAHDALLANRSALAAREKAFLKKVMR